MTPFQFVGQNTEDELREKPQHLLRSVKSRKISVSYHASHTSFLEAVFAKGDRRLSRVLVEAYRRGCCFEGWDEQFRYDTWLEDVYKRQYQPWGCGAACEKRHGGSEPRFHGVRAL